MRHEPTAVYMIYNFICNSSYRFVGLPENGDIRDPLKRKFSLPPVSLENLVIDQQLS